jgi:hypothetical protein
VQYPLTEAAPPVVEFVGFGIYNRPTMHSLRLPFWFILLTSGSTGTYLWRRSRTPPAGHCPKCSYDLTGNVSGVCPECGTEIPKSAAEFSN